MRLHYINNIAIIGLLLLLSGCEKKQVEQSVDASADVGENPDMEVKAAKQALISNTGILPIGDTTLRLVSPFHNYGDYDTISATAASVTNYRNSLIKFDQSAIQAQIGDSELLSAKIEITIDSISSEWMGGSIAIHRMTMPWEEDGATWACADDYFTGMIGDYYDNCFVWDKWGMDWWSIWPQPFESTPSYIIPIYTGQTGVVSFDVTVDVQSFLSGQVNNFGWMVAGTEDLLSGEWVRFSSREGSSPPKLVLEYDSGQITEEEEQVIVNVKSDTFVSELFPDTNRDGETVLKANSDQTLITKHALVEFSDSDITTQMAAKGIGPDWELYSAKIIMTVKNPWPISLMNLGHTVDVHRMRQPWEADRATWKCSIDTDTSNVFQDCSGFEDWDMFASDPNDLPYEYIPSDSRLAEIFYGAEMEWDVTK